MSCTRFGKGKSLSRNEYGCKGTTFFRDTQEKSRLFLDNVQFDAD